MAKRGRPTKPARERKSVQVWTRLSPAEAKFCETFSARHDSTLAHTLYEALISFTGLKDADKAI